MAENSAFKENINFELIQRLSAENARVWKPFRRSGFEQSALSGLQAMQLKQRIDHVVKVWAGHLPPDYPKALIIILKTLGPALKLETFGDDFWYHWLHAHFVQIFGLDHPDLSLKAMLQITQRGSCEFTLRPYLVQHGAKTRAFLKSQLKHPSAHVRRWISEGSRPRLPWGQRLQSLVKDPGPNLGFLKALRKDKSKYVRTSVANHVNDIAKDHPALAVKLMNTWLKENFEHADWIAKKGLRHLIKQGHPGALRALGFSSGTKAQLSALRLEKKRVKVGESQAFGFKLTGGAAENLSIDYAVIFQLSKHKTGQKVFKLTSKKIKKGEVLEFSKKHSFKPITTRRYYNGRHSIEILINGRRLGRAGFELVTGK